LTYAETLTPRRAATRTTLFPQFYLGAETPTA
jgi:hypothetical protein